MKNLRAMSTYQETPRSRMAAGTQPNIRSVPAINPDETFFHFEIRRALEMHRGLALGIFLIALAVCCGYLARRWHTYKADSIVYVQPAPPKLLQTGQSQQWPFDANTYETYIEQQIHNVTRSDVLAAAVQRIPDFRGAKESLQAAADRLGGNLEVNRVSTGYQISITATAGSAAEAAQMANAVADSFIQSATRELRSGDSQRLELLREERDRVEKELASDRTEQDSLNKQLGVASVGAAPDFYDDQIAAIRAELVKARTDNDEAAAKLMATAGGGPSSAALDAAADEIVAADPGLVSMKTALNKRRSDLISQMSNLKPDHPLYKQDAEELAKIQGSLDAMTKDLRAKASGQIEQRLKSDLERTSSVEERLNAQLGQMTRAAGSATPRLQRANDLATDVARLQARFTEVDDQYRNLSLEVAAPGAVYLAAPAVAPLHADRKKVYRNALIVLLGGIVFALAGALIALNLDPRIYISADVERVLGFAPMALLPDLYEVGTGVAEEYMLRLAAAVEHAHQQGNLHSCIFTGVAPGAGATTVSTRVTNMLQAMGRETVLVDAVGVPPEETVNPGTGLVHIPRGSRSMALLQQMTAGDDEAVVVTDTAPLLVSGETEYLARFVDSAIIVIESGVTTKAQLREVTRTLERLDVAAVGFVLNRISLTNANPAFRLSVRAVEKHLKAQARTFDRQRKQSTPPAEETVVEKRERQTPMYERLQAAVSEPVDEPGRGGTDAQQSQMENSAPTGAVPVWHTKNSVPAYAVPVWPVEGSSPVDAQPASQMDNIAPAEDEKSIAAEASLAEVHMEESGADDPLHSPWREIAPAPFDESKPTLFGYAVPINLQMDQSRTGNPRWWENAAAPSAGTQPEPYAENLSGPFEESKAANFHENATSPGPTEDRELPSYLRRPLETSVQPSYEDFLRQPLEPVARWEDGFAPAEETVELGQPDYLHRPDAFDPNKTIVEPARMTSQAASDYAASDYAAVAPGYPAASPGFGAVAAAQDSASPAIHVEEPVERQAESWRLGPSISARAARGRDGVHVILGGQKSAPLTGEEVPDVWRDLLRAEEEAAYAAQQAQEFWRPATPPAEGPYAYQRPPEDFNVPPPPEPISEPRPPEEPAYPFETSAAVTGFVQPTLDAEYGVDSNANTADFMRTPVESPQPFESDAEEADVLPLQTEFFYASPASDERFYREQPPSDTFPHSEEPAWAEIGEISSRRTTPFAELIETSPKPEPLREWWEELTAGEAQPVMAETPAFAPSAPAAINAPAMPDTLPALGARPIMEPDAKVSPQTGEQDGELYSAASRLSGLRNLLVSLGIQNLHQASEQRKAEARNEPRYERPPERPVYAQPVNPNGNGGLKAASAEVIAPPQIIPPTFNPLAVTREKEPKTPLKPPPINRWDSVDDVDILPSRRGQYRQRY